MPARCLTLPRGKAFPWDCAPHSDSAAGTLNFVPSCLSAMGTLLPASDSAVAKVPHSASKIVQWGTAHLGGA